MAILPGVERALEKVDAVDWQKELAKALAADLDEKPNASMARELRVLMSDLGAEAPAERGDVSDDLASKRAARRAAAS